MRYLWGWVGLVLLGCSDGSSDAGSDSYDRDTKLDDLSSGEGEALCAEINAMAHGDSAYLDRVCTSVGALVSQSMPAKCMTERDLCIAEKPPLCWQKPGGSGGRDVDCKDATVGMFKDCMQGSVRATKELYAGITCATPSAEVSKLAFDALEMRADKPPAECAAFKQACPAFFVPPDLDDP
jgi:hypothetical protein